MIEKKAKLSRRNFMLTLGAGGVAAAAAVVATSSTKSSAEQTSKDKRATRGYQASAHVNNYYRTTKV